MFHEIYAYLFLLFIAGWLTIAPLRWAVRWLNRGSFGKSRIARGMDKAMDLLFSPVAPVAILTTFSAFSLAGAYKNIVTGDGIGTMSAAILFAWSFMGLFLVVLPYLTGLRNELLKRLSARRQQRQMSHVAGAQEA